MTRTKAVGLGLALMAGSAHAADPVGNPPALLPVGMTVPATGLSVPAAGWATSPEATPAAPVWLPARPAKPPADPFRAPGSLPVHVPDTRPAPPPAYVPAVVAELPAIPVAVEAAPPVAIPVPPALVPKSAAPPLRPLEPRPQPEFQPKPSAVVPNVPAPPPAAVPNVPAPPAVEPKPQVPAQPRPQPAPADAPRVRGPESWGTPGPQPRQSVYGEELPTAPPGLMAPAAQVVPGGHGTFGSPPVRISKDYPSIREMLGFPHGDAGPAADRYFVSAEYLLWWVRAGNVPALATTSTAPGGLGFIGEPGTVNLLGAGSFGSTGRQGVRVRAGAWFGECAEWGVDGSVFVLADRGDSVTFLPQLFPTITRPIFSPNPMRVGEFGEVVSRPGFSSGSLTIDQNSSLWGADLNLKKSLCRDCDFRAEIFAGYRFLSLSENLRITEDILALADATQPAGTRSLVQDSFDVRNRFHGAQVGGAFERRWGAFSLEARLSVALGVNRQELEVAGFQRVTQPDQTAAQFIGGLLAAGPNLGKFTSERFAVVPEGMVNAGYWITPNVKATIGYTFIYWSHVLRPGDGIDRVVDVTFVPNPPMNAEPSGLARPAPRFQQSDFWAQGLQFGMEFRW